MLKNSRKFNQRGAVSVQSALLVGTLATSTLVGGVAYASSQSSTPIVYAGDSMCVTAEYVGDSKLNSYKGDCIIETPTPSPTNSTESVSSPTPSPSVTPTATPTSEPSVTPTPTPTVTVAQPTIGTAADISSVANTATTVGIPTEIATSTDGSKVVAIQAKKIFSSSDYGQTWNLLADISTSIAGNSIYFSSVTPSKDGTSFYVSPGTERSASSIWFYKVNAVTKATTATWLPTGDLPSFTSIDVSDNGAKFVAMRSDGFAYRASSVGSWTKGSSLGINMQVASSGDATKSLAVGFGGAVYKSIDSGVTWTNLKQPSVQKWVSIDSDAAGNKWFATTQGGNVFYSTDMGATWIPYEILGTGTWSNISVSTDGQVIVVGKGGSTGQVFFSKDGGATWATSSSLSGGFWGMVNISPDGHRFYVRNNTGVKTGAI